MVQKLMWLCRAGLLFFSVLCFSASFSRSMSMLTPHELSPKMCLLASPLGAHLGHSALWACTVLTLL